MHSCWDAIMFFTPAEHTLSKMAERAATQEESPDEDQTSDKGKLRKAVEFVLDLLDLLISLF